MKGELSLKKSCQIICLLGLIFFPLFVTKAEEKADSSALEKALKELQTNESVIVVSRVGFNNAHIAEQNKHQIKVFFEMENPGQAESDLLYGLQLEKKIDQNNYAAMEEKYFSERISLGQGETISRQIEYDIPEFYSGDFRLWLVGKNVSGTPRGITYLGEIKLEGTNQYIEADNCFLQIGTEEKKYTLQEGVSYKPDEVVNLTCDFINHFDKPIAADLTYQLFRRSIFNGEGIDPAPNSKETLSFQEKEEKTTAGFTLPRIEKPQAYDLLLQLKDQNQKIVSHQIKIHLVVAGETMTISNLKLDKESYRKGEQAKVQLDWTGPADNFPDSRQITQGQNFKVTVFADLTDGAGEICAKDFQSSFDINQDYGWENFSIPIQRDCSVIQGSFKVKNDQGEVLDTWELNFNPKAQKPAVIPEKKQVSSQQKIVIGIFILIILSLTIAFLMIWWKKKNAIGKIALYLLLLGGTMFFSSKAEAATSATLQVKAKDSSCCGNGCPVDVRWPFCYCRDDSNRCFTNGAYGTSAQATISINKSSYNPGESIVISTTGYDISPCSNTTYAMSVYCLSFNGSTCPYGMGTIYTQTAYNTTAYFSNKWVSITAPTSPGNYYLLVGLSYMHPPFQKTVASPLNFSVVNNNSSCSAYFYPSSIDLNGGSTVYWSNTNADSMYMSCSGPVSMGWTSVSTSGNFYRTYPNIGTETCTLYPYKNGVAGTTCSASLNVYGCTNSVPSGSVMCPSDNSGLSQTLSWHYIGTSSANCSSTKCEYYTPPAAVNGQCGPAATTYPYTATTFSGAFCNSGTASPASPAFPALGSSTTWTCQGQNGGSSINCTATRQSCPTIGISLAANPATISQGYSSVISWSTSNATSCGLYRQSDNYYLAGGTSGTAIVSPSSTTTYRLGCANSCNSASQYATVTVTYACQGSIPANATAFDAEESSSLTNNSTYWSYSASDTATKCQYKCNNGYIWNGSSCVVPLVNGSCGPAATTYSYTATAFSGAFCNSGTASPASPAFPALGSSTTWTCLGQNGGSSINCTATRQSCPTIGITLTANPTSIISGGSSVIAWSSTNATSCSLVDTSDNSTIATGLSNTGLTVSPAMTKTYQLNCSNSCTSASQYVTVTVNYICTSNTPANATLCSGDDIGLTANTPKTLVPSCSATKCEYTCNSGYIYKAGQCTTPIPGKCGSADGGVFCKAPTTTADLCSYGSPSSVILSSNKWTWTCTGDNPPYPPASCSARKECPWIETGS